MSLIKRLLGTLRKNNLESEIGDELQFHLEMRIREFTARGMSSDEARHQAARLLGNQLLLKERIREMDTIGWIETLAQDLRYALRLLSKTPSFTAVAITTLALGIGANTAIFSLMNALVLRPMRVQDPDRLVMITETKLKEREGRVPTTAALVEWKKHSRTLQDVSLAGFYSDPVTLSGIGRAERVNEGYCGPNFFSLLGVKPFRGQLFLPEIQNGEGTTVVISENLWQRTFAADLNILGKTVTIAGNKKTIVGVLPPGFSVFPWDMQVDVWLAIDPGWSLQMRWLPTIGRLRPGVSKQQAQAELAAIARGMGHQDADAEWSIRLEPLQQEFVGELRGYFYILLGAVGFILLIACANMANLLLARGAVRQCEMAIRASLGASRGRLIRQLFAESTLLALVGGAAGVLIGFWAIRVLISAAPMEWIHSVSISLDLRVLAFTLSVSLLTAVLFGLVPALRASKPDLHESLKAIGRPSAGISRQRGQGVLLVSEIALAIVLLVGAGLMVNSFIRARKVDLGFDPRNVLSADVFLDGPKFWYNTPGKPGGSMKTITPQADIFYRSLLDRVERLPAVLSAGISHRVPPGDIDQRTFRIIGRPAPVSGHKPEAGYDEVSAGFFRSLGIPLLKGRYVTDRDDEGSSWVVDINETLARRFFPNEDPIGKLLQTEIAQGSELTHEENRPREIVGVVADVRHFGFGSDPFPIMYGSYRQHESDYPGGTYHYHTWKSITLRSAGNPFDLVVPLQQAVAAVDKDQALFAVKSVDQGLSDSVSFPRFQMQLFGIFGGLGLILAAVGIYGVMSYVVAQRAHEIGLRVALGAGRADVLRLVVGRGVKTTIIGLATGIAGSLALTRLLARFLFGVKTTDPTTYAIVSVLLLAVALAACYVPARRATKVDPMIAIRHE